MALLPPSSVGPFGSQRPAGYAGIINAGVFVRRNALGDLVKAVGPYNATEGTAPGSGSYEAEDLIFRLVRKGIADADLFRRWTRAGVP